MVIHKSFSTRVFGYQCPIHEMCQTCKRKMSVFLIVEKPGPGDQVNGDSTRAKKVKLSTEVATKGTVRAM